MNWRCIWGIAAHFDVGKTGDISLGFLTLCANCFCFVRDLDLADFNMYLHCISEA